MVPKAAPHKKTEGYPQLWIVDNGKEPDRLREI